jgi:Spy/CpxP family protein refolding chaperone
MMGPRLLVLIVMVALPVVGGVAVRAQQPPASAAQSPPSVSPVEIQRMFDAYALVQAQDRLKLGDEQFSQFLPRFKALQEVRRRGQVDRARVLRDLNRKSQAEQVDEAALKDQLRALQDIDAKLATDVKKASDAIDQVLDIRQQASFRVFEEMMERRKIDLMTRARQNRPKARE